MPSASRTIAISTTPEKAFAFFADPANDQKWRSGVKEISALGPAAVGSKVHQVVAGPGGRSIAADIEITGYEPPTRYAFKAIAGPARPVGEFRISPTASGCEVTFNLSAELGFLKGLLMGGPVQGTMNGEMAALDKAKQVLEAG